jgi:hypothetical protein
MQKAKKRQHGKGLKTALAVGGPGFKSQSQGPHQGSVGREDRNRWIVDVGGLPAHAVQLNHPELAALQGFPGFGPHIVPAEVEALVRLAQFVDRRIELGRYEMSCIQKDRAAAMRADFHQLKLFAQAENLVGFGRPQSGKVRFGEADGARVAQD